MRKIRPYLLLALLAAGVAWLIITLNTPGQRPVIISAYEGPRLKVENPETTLFDKGGKALAVFHLYNVGGRRLNILRVESPPEWHLKISKRHISPGSHIALRLAPPASAPPVRFPAKVVVFTNDAKSHRVVLKIRD